jgi:hypothetical protein
VRTRSDAKEGARSETRQQATEFRRECDHPYIRVQAARQRSHSSTNQCGRCLWACTRGRQFSVVSVHASLPTSGKLLPRARDAPHGMRRRSSLHTPQFPRRLIWHASCFCACRPIAVGLTSCRSIWMRTSASTRTH